MVFWYKNSFLASVVSVFGCALVIAGIGSFQNDVALALGCIPVGVVLALWGKQISDNKAFKKWWKQVEDNNLESVIARDLNTAITIYRKNPQKRTIKKIAALNPSYAEYIRQNIAGKK